MRVLSMFIVSTLALCVANTNAATIGLVVEPQGPTTGLVYAVIDEPEFSNPFMAKSFSFQLQADDGLQLAGLESGILPKLFPFTIPTLSGSANLATVNAESQLSNFIGGFQALAAVRYEGATAGNYQVKLNSWSIKDAGGNTIPVSLDPGVYELELPNGQLASFASFANVEIVPEPSVIAGGLFAAMSAFLGLRRR